MEIQDYPAPQDLKENLDILEAVIIAKTSLKVIIFKSHFHKLF